MNEKESLLASLATIETIARAADVYDEPRWLVHRREEGDRAEVQTWPSGDAVADVAYAEQAVHIARWGPEQVLACNWALRELIGAVDEPKLLDLLGRVVRDCRD
jgi:hypothetical protein